MKTYRIVKEGAAWWVLSPTSGDPIVSSSELEEIVDWVRALARRSGGIIELFDADGNGQRPCNPVPDRELVARSALELRPEFLQNRTLRPTDVLPCVTTKDHRRM